MSSISMPRPYEGEFSGPGVWRRDDLQSSSWLVKIDDAAEREICKFVEAYRVTPVPMYLIEPNDYELPHCRAMLAKVRTILSEGPRFVVIDKLDMNFMSDDEARIVYWLFSSILSRPVAQSMNGTIVVDVTDRGEKAKFGGKVRINQTNQDADFHNDNVFNPMMPDIVGLLCLRAAKSGGTSRVMSFQQVHNLLRQHYPEALPRLYRNFWWDRQGQFPAGEESVISEPVFTFDGKRLTARLSHHMIYGGFVKKETEVDAESKAALDAMQAVFEMKEYQFDFNMERGQIQYVQNLEVGHARTNFVDFEEPELRRCYVRLWLRDQGRRSYMG